MNKQLRLWALAVTVLLLVGCTYLVTSQTVKPALPVVTQAAIASAHPLATQAGMDILAQGGNAFDAAVAVAASLGVVEPYSAGLGGGGFWLLYDASTSQYRFIDARETAPKAAHRDFYLNKHGQVNRDRAINGPSAAAIPGQAAAFVHLAEHYGQLPLSKTLAPAIAQANAGFAVTEIYRQWLSFRLPVMRRYAESAKIFLHNHDIPARGHIIRQPELAQTLQLLAQQGFAGFYQGELAQQMVTAVNAQGGQWTLADLADYRVIEREPLKRRYGEMEVISAPPPSAGGVAIFEMLNMLNHFQWQSLPKVQQTHLIAEIMRRAYLDRAQYLGDPDFIDIPLTELLSEQRAQAWIASIRMDEATASMELAGPAPVAEGFHTTHFSVLDQYGNQVSATLSINLPFGSAFTVAGTGVLLNNEMDDFSARPNEANAYGLVGSEANAIAPGKRPLSSMTPTIVNSPTTTAILGTPGGSRIISMVFLALLEHWQHKPVKDWVARTRFHHQYLPDVIEYEPSAFNEDELQELAALGHILKNTGRKYGNMQAILWDKQAHTVSAASDPRGEGLSKVKE